MIRVRAQPAGRTAREAIRRARTALLSGLLLAIAALGPWTHGPAAARAPAPVPSPAHVVVVVFENHSYGQVIGNPRAPYLNALRSGGADLTASYAETHPSQPNYFTLFSGSTQGVTDDTCRPPGFSHAPDLASELIAAGRTWASYNEALPHRGSTICAKGMYARKHNPWFGFSDVPASSAYTFAQFPADPSRLPQVSFVVPDLCDDMHDCPVRTGDTWLKDHLGGYAAWAKTHDSLLVVTFDENDGAAGNRIPTVLYGGPVVPGSSTSTPYHHVDLLRTLEDMYGTGHAGRSAAAAPITGIWKS